MSADKKALITVISIVFLGGIFFMLSKDNSESVNTKTNNAETSLSSYSSQEVAEHKTKSDCWTNINGSVYDITSYVNGHPGGDNILSACGTDATEYFNGEKAGQAGGTNDHSGDSQALSQLARLKIGELAN